jgi:ribose transport system substrate-binding protein
VQTLVSNIQALVGQGAKALIMAPQDTASIGSELKKLNGQNIPVVSIDTRPDAGDVFMVVRADNRQLRAKACEFLRDKLGGKNTVVVLQGGQDSVNGSSSAHLSSAAWHPVRTKTTNIPSLASSRANHSWGSTT